MGVFVLSKFWIALGSAVFLLASLLPPLVPPASAAMELIGAVCAFETMNVEFTNSPLGVVPAGTTVHFHGSALCVTSGEPVLGIGSISATVDPPPGTGINCVAGVAGGTGLFVLNPQLGVFGVDVTVVNVGGTWTVTIVSPDLRLAGVGEFVQAPADTAACALGPVSSTTWTGPLVVQDP